MTMIMTMIIFFLFSFILFFLTVNLVQNDNILFDQNLQIEITIYNSLEKQIINKVGLETTIKTK